MCTTLNNYSFLLHTYYVLGTCLHLTLSLSVLKNATNNLLRCNFGCRKHSSINKDNPFVRSFTTLDLNFLMRFTGNLLKLPALFFAKVVVKIPRKRTKSEYLRSTSHVTMYSLTPPLPTPSIAITLFTVTRYIVYVLFRPILLRTVLVLELLMLIPIGFNRRWRTFSLARRTIPFRTGAVKEEALANTSPDGAVLLLFLLCTP